MRGLKAETRAAEESKRCSKPRLVLKEEEGGREAAANGRLLGNGCNGNALNKGVQKNRKDDQLSGSGGELKEGEIKSGLERERGLSRAQNQHVKARARASDTIDSSDILLLFRAVKRWRHHMFLLLLMGCNQNYHCAQLIYSIAAAFARLHARLGDSSFWPFPRLQ